MSTQTPDSLLTSKLQNAKLASRYKSLQFPSRKWAHDTATWEQAYPPVQSTPSFHNEAAMSRFVSSMDQLTVKTSLPPMEVVRYSGDPCTYYNSK